MQLHYLLVVVMSDVSDVIPNQIRVLKKN